MTSTIYADSATLPNINATRFGTMVSDPDLPLETVRILNVSRSGDNNPTVRRVHYMKTDGTKAVAFVPRSAPVRTRQAVTVRTDVLIGAVPAVITKVTAKTVTVTFDDGTDKRFTRREAGDGAITYMNGKDVLTFG